MARVRTLPRIEPCPTSSSLVTSCPPTDASAAGPPRCAARSSRHSSGRAPCCWAHRTGRLPSRTSSGGFARDSAELFRAPNGYEVLVGNGGSTAFWDAAAFGLIETRSQNLVFGEFGGKFASAAKAPWLQAPDVREAAAGTRTTAEPVEGVDVYAWPHNETSTGVSAPITPGGRRCRRAHGHRRHQCRGRDRLLGPRGGRVLLRAAEEPRLGRWTVVRRGLARGDRAHRADRRFGPLHPRVPEPEERARQFAPQPDAEHPGSHDPRAARSAAGMDPRPRRPAMGRRPHPGVLAGALRVGGGIRRSRRRSWPIPPTARPWS